MTTWNEETGANASSKRRPGAGADALRARARAFAGLPKTATPDRPLGGLAPTAMHQLERADAHVRHSIVKACLYNLNAAADALPARWQDAAFQSDLARGLDDLAGIAGLIDEFFQRPLSETATLAALCPSEYRQVHDTLDRMARVAGRRVMATLSQATARSFAADLQASVAELTAELEVVTRHIRRCKVDLHSLVTDVLRRALPRCTARGVKVFFNDATGGTARTFVDRDRVLGSLGELIENALKYAFAEPVDTPRIDVALAFADEHKLDARIVIADNGPGVPDDQLARLTERGTTRGGTGEGLAMVKEVVETLHRGRLELGPRKGGGFQATISLPLVLRG
jgi:signal transduction histidine kinase